ncbi:hypothetical protein AZA_60708 [Nitrospirillum viridazoti Y2]|nr:hypothetical protein AZA_60708 [Nitrospirillum amazonense Y2]
MHALVTGTGATEAAAAEAVMAVEAVRTMMRADGPRQHGVGLFLLIRREAGV